MKKAILILFAATLAVYLVVFYWIEHRRAVKGPWLVSFSQTDGIASLTVRQPYLGISNVQIRLPPPALTTNLPGQLRFSEARPVPFDVPFGQCVFQDTTFLPGTIALRFSGHEVQLMPRVLTIDKVERPWRNGEIIELK